MMIKYYSEVTPKDVQWLWYPYIPYGKITLLQGDPGEGKSTFALQMAAVLTNGGCFPDGYETKTPQTVIYQCAEDGTEDTIKPRLIKAGADCSRIAFISEGDSKLTIGDERIEQAIADTDARCLILDPIQSFVSQDGDMNSASKMRSVMSSLSDIAQRYMCAVIIIGHMTKSTGGKQLYRGLGSIDIAAIARSILMITRDETHPEIRYMTPVKSSLAPEGGAIGFLLDKDTGFNWLGKCKIKKEESTLDKGRAGKKEKVKELLKVMLSDGHVPSTLIYDRLKSLGISERTVRTAVSELNVRSEKKGNIWFLYLDNDQFL